MENKINFKQKFEPPVGKVLHGAGQSPEQFEKYWDAVEDYKPKIYMLHVRFDEVKEKLAEKIKQMNKINNSLIPQVGLNLKSRKKDSQCLQIARGIYDSDILFLIDFLREFNRPVFLRIGYEFNLLSHHYNPEEFIAAWRYISNLFKKKECVNVAFVWCACTAMNRDINEIMAYYPGDDYVDWFGDDLFGVRHFTETTNPKIISKAFLGEAEKHMKPVMIGESSAEGIGVEKGIESWNEWFKPYFKWIKEHQIIKAFCYINWDWGKDWKLPEWGNCRIEENEVIRKLYVKELSKKKYIHNNK